MISLNNKIKNNKFLSYVFFAVITSGINVCSYILFYNFIFSNIIVSNVFAYTISIMVSFIINKKIVFKNNNEEILIQIVLYLMVKMIAFGVDSIVLIGINKFFNLSNFVAKLIANISTTLSNYTLNNKIVFKNIKDSKIN